MLTAPDRAGQEQVTIVCASAGTGKISLLRAWADQAGQGRRLAFVIVRPGQLDTQLFRLTVLGTIRAAETATLRWRRWHPVGNRDLGVQQKLGLAIGVQGLEIAGDRAGGHKVWRADDFRSELPMGDWS